MLTDQLILTDSSIVKLIFVIDTSIYKCSILLSK